MFYPGYLLDGIRMLSVMPTHACKPTSEPRTFGVLLDCILGVLLLLSTVILFFSIAFTLCCTAVISDKCGGIHAGVTPTR